MTFYVVVQWRVNRLRRDEIWSWISIDRGEVSLTRQLIEITLISSLPFITHMKK